MAHESENVKRLAVEMIDVRRLDKLATSHSDAAEVWLLVLPFGRTIRDVEASAAWFATLRKFAQTLNEKSVLAILTSAQDAAETWPKLSDLLKFQLWVAAKLLTSISTDARHLPENHAALLILSKYNTSLQHTKTRIAYTYCPSCDVTVQPAVGTATALPSF
jgi:hypothetical protein